MATIIVCDECGAREGVLHGLCTDLCHPCAMIRVGYVEQAMIDKGLATAQNGKPAPPLDLPPATPVDPVLKRIEELTVKHGHVVLIKPNPQATLSPGAKIQHGAERQKRMVELIEPATDGDWIAKLAE